MACGAGLLLCRCSLAGLLPSQLTAPASVSAARERRSCCRWRSRAQASQIERRLPHGGSRRPPPPSLLATPASFPSPLSAPASVSAPSGSGVPKLQLPPAALASPWRPDRAAAALVWLDQAKECQHAF
uniref:Uncharacterized protein n=1 Tax=Leersia perrieri TaxID=77586 RepID=A0A0D9WR19_9ORYZ